MQNTGEQGRRRSPGGGGARGNASPPGYNASPSHQPQSEIYNSGKESEIHNSDKESDADDDAVQTEPRYGNLDH